MLQDFPPVIAINPEGMLAASINQFEEAMAAANANATAGVATDIKQELKQQGGNVLVNMVSMQDCNFQECTNLTEMVGKQGCSAQNPLSDALACKEYCDARRAEGDTDCTCATPETCEPSVLDVVWGDECSKRRSQEDCVAQRVMGGRSMDSCIWRESGSGGYACRKKEDCSVVTQAGDREGAGCTPPLAAEAFFKKNQLRACWGKDTGEHRGCVHGDIDDPMAPTVANDCLGLCVVGKGVCSDGVSPNSAFCTKEFHTWARGRCTEDRASTKEMCAKSGGEWVPGKCSDGASAKKSTCESKKHTWTPSCPSEDQTERLPAKPALPGSTAYRRMLLCQRFAEKNYPFEALKNTEEDKYRMDYYDSLMLASRPIATCKRLGSQELCGENPECLWKSGQCIKSPQYAKSVLTSICDTIGAKSQCDAHSDCKWSSAGQWCEVDGDQVESRRQNLKDSINRRIDENTRKFCYDNVRIDKSVSGYKKVCHRMLAGEDIDDAQTCPPGFHTLPMDEFGIVHDSPTEGTGAEGSVCSSEPGEPLKCRKCDSNDQRLCQRQETRGDCEYQQVCEWAQSDRTGQSSCVDVPCHERAQAQCRTNCVWRAWGKGGGVCEACVMAQDRNIGGLDGGLDVKNPVAALAPLRLTNMTYGGQCTIKNISQINERTTSLAKDQTKNKVDHSLSNMDLASIRQALRGAGAAAMAGYSAEKESEAQNIAEQTQKAAVNITNQVAQACGQKGEKLATLMANLVGQSCVNTRKCVIDGVEQRNTLEKVEKCVQNINVSNKTKQNLLNRINQLGVEGAEGLKGSLIDTIVWSTVVLGSIAALVAWVSGGMSSGITTVFIGTAVVAGVGLQLWLPSRRDAATTLEYIMHGSVKREPGNYRQSSYDPLPKACGMQHFKAVDNVRSRQHAYTICKNNPTCKTFFFKSDADTAVVSRDAACASKNKQECQSDSKCTTLPKYQWTTRWYGFLSHTSGEDSNPTMHLVEELLRDTADVGDAPNSSEVADLLSQGKDVTFEAEGSAAITGTVEAISNKTIRTDNPQVKTLPYGTRITFATEGFGICDDGVSQSRTACLAAADCVAGPPTDKFESDCKISNHCPAECATDPFETEGDRKGKLKHMCGRCCVAKAGKTTECQPYVDFVGGRRILQCSSCKKQSGKMWMYDENVGAKRSCSDPQYKTREECESHSGAWARCMANIDQPHLVTGDQLQCFDRVDRWLGYAAPKYPYAKAGRELAVEAAAWGVGIAVAILLAHIICANVPGLNKAMGLVE